MQRDFGKFLVALGLTFGIAMAMYHFLGQINAEWTRVSIDMVKHSMSDQKPYQDQLFSIETQSWTVWVLGLLGIALSWIGAFKLNYNEWMGRASMLMVLAILSTIITACGTSSNVVIVTPPNYVIVVDLSNASNQGEAPSDFNNGQLLQVAQVPVSSHPCAMNSQDSCPDKLVAEVEGSPQSRIYTRETNSGTDQSNQALCFEAQGTNGCLDFSVNAIIQKDDAKCYANKMGVTAVKNQDGSVSRFHYVSMPLATALDTRVMQIAGAVFAKRVVETNPLQLASKKFNLFDEARADIVKGVHDQTCITLLDIGMAQHLKARQQLDVMPLTVVKGDGFDPFVAL